MLSRRTVLKTIAAAPLGAAVACSVRPSPAARPAGPRPLPIPPLAPSIVGADGVRRFSLDAAAGTSEMIAGKRTATWGFNGAILGPTLRARRGEKVAVAITNGLGEATTVHWHGMSIPAEFDGGPHQMIEPGGSTMPTWTVEQQAATLWYHPHPHGSTQRHVLRGLAGLFLVDDDASDSLGLPKTYGTDDIPLIIQDRRFTAAGAIDESDNSKIGSLGDTIITNGIADAYLTVSTGAVRLRILNGSSGRLYNLVFADNRRFDVVASDGGLLAAPAAMRRIQLSPGERAEIVVVLRAGENLTLTSSPIDDDGGVKRSDADRFGMTDRFDILRLRAQPRLTPSVATPSTLVPSAAIPTAGAVRRSFDLQWFMINRKRMDMNRIDFEARVGGTEVWTVTNKDNWPHNFHVHDAQFHIVDIDGRRPPAQLAGRKDTVYVPPGSRVRLALRWSTHADPMYPYMFHCHLLMHEDQGMMGQFLLLRPGQQAMPMNMPMNMPMAH
ncbi:multicopper oxidase domain-containing protein [Gordonia sp. TBRC 11910]|uniref:Multicopper oxidase CueO n=1 Tax=Gordonia asplenii TaxID=2725283 RepID=A0A848L1B7_9ACTN|nr:multicopper oxidase domain-containing protein [Gordonia asplenii]NMO02311.1 multicopper oxidase domain-containing protein [Gordonia asplenii]